MLNINDIKLTNRNRKS